MIGTNTQSISTNAGVINENTKSIGKIQDEIESQIQRNRCAYFCTEDQGCTSESCNGGGFFYKVRLNIILKNSNYLFYLQIHQMKFMTVVS